MPVSKIAYQTKGSGPYLLLLHGYAGSVLHWDEVAEKLAKKYTVIVPNLSHVYMGQTEISFSDQVKLVSQFLKINFPDQKVSVSGISYGGAIAWGLACRHSDQVEKLALVNPMPPNPMKKFRFPAIKYMFHSILSPKMLGAILSTPIGKMVLRKVSEAFRVERADFWDRVDSLKGRRLAFVTHVLYRFGWILRNEKWNDWEDQLRSLNIPMLMIFDPKDPLFVDPTYFEFSNFLDLNDADRVIIPNASHMAIHYKPSEVADAIGAFMAVTQAQVKLKSAV